jgi:RHS repeat-associated protein
MTIRPCPLLGAQGRRVTPAREENWVYDPSGNWYNYKRRSNGSLQTNQNRRHNKVNEITTYASSSVPASFDRAGNMKRIPRALSGTSYYEASWDAWNRLVRLKTPGSSPVGSYSGTALNVTYAYDGLFRRTKKNVLTGSSSGLTHFYYNAEWKCVEERQGSSTSASKQFIFGARGRNDLVFRERFGTGAGRHYALCDNMGSKVAITNASGSVQERYSYTAFGDLESVMAADYTPRGNNKSNYDWETLYHGEVRDDESGYYNYGYRYYVPMLGKWPSRDPIGEQGGINLYAFVGNNGVNNWDLNGMKPCSDYSKSRAGDTPTGLEGRTLEDEGYEKKFNGCDAPDSHYKVVYFTQACNDHDICYQTCGETQASCDSALRSAMRSACFDQLPWWMSAWLPSCLLQAEAYYHVLQAVAGEDFEETQDYHCKWECCEE